MKTLVRTIDGSVFIGTLAINTPFQGWARLTDAQYLHFKMDDLSKVITKPQRWVSIFLIPNPVDIPYSSVSFAIECGAGWNGR
jgi:hypothetical protein